MKLTNFLLLILIIPFLVEGGKVPSRKKIWKELQKLDSYVKDDIADTLDSLEDQQESLTDDIESLEQKIEAHDDMFDTIESSIHDLNDILAWTILENAGEDLITDEDLQGSPPEVVGKMAQKVLYSPAEPKGIPFGPINGPYGNDTRIGVVGGGIGGVHMAYLLKKKGFNDVTILEKTNRLGGQIDSIDVRGTKTTWHVWSWLRYDRFLPLMMEFGFGPQMVNMSRDLMEYWILNDPSIPTLDGKQFLVSQTMQEYQIQDPNMALALLIKQCSEYINIHRKIFGKQEQHLMRRPDPSYLPLFSGSIMDFVERFNLKALLAIFRTWFNFYGYGTMTTLPVTYLFLYLTPEAIIEHLMSMPKGTLNDRSIDEVFPMMIEDQNINTIFDFEVSFIEKLDTGEYKLYSQDGDSETFDFLIWAGLPSDFPQLLYPCDMKNYLSQLFSTQESNYVNLVSLSMRNRIGPPIQVYSQQLNSDKFENGVTVDADNYAYQNEISVEDYENNYFTYADGSSAEVKSFWSLQYCYCKPSEAESIQEVIEHYKAFNGTDIEVDGVRTWEPVHPRWDVESAAQGKLWDLYDFQGTENVWIIGAGTSFGQMNIIMEYNELLVSNMI